IPTPMVDSGRKVGATPRLSGMLGNAFGWFVLVALLMTTISTYASMIAATIPTATPVSVQNLRDLGAKAIASRSSPTQTPPQIARGAPLELHHAGASGGASRKPHELTATRSKVNRPIHPMPRSDMIMTALSSPPPRGSPRPMRRRAWYATPNAANERTPTGH